MRDSAMRRLRLIEWPSIHSAVIKEASPCQLSSDEVKVLCTKAGVIHD